MTDARTAERTTQPSADDQSSLPYASLASRSWAAILDFVACYLLFAFALSAVAIFGSVPDKDFDLVFGTLSVAILWLYFAGFESSAARATPGKRQARIVVTDARGARISFARASLRLVGKLLILATGGIALLPILFDRQRRALDDFVAGTRVHDVEAVAKGGPRPAWRKAIVPVIFFVGIGLAVKTGIDAQNDQRQRSAIVGLLSSVRTQLQAPYVGYYEINGRAPTTRDLSFSDPQVRVFEVDAGGALVLHLNRPSGAALHLTPVFGNDGSVTWICRAEAEQLTWFPASCRQ